MSHFSCKKRTVSGEFILLIASLSSQAELWDAGQLRNGEENGERQGCAEDCCSSHKSRSFHSKRKHPVRCLYSWDCPSDRLRVSSLSSHETSQDRPCVKAQGKSARIKQSQQGRNPHLPHGTESDPRTSRGAFQASSPVWKRSKVTLVKTEHKAENKDLWKWWTSSN